MSDNWPGKWRSATESMDSSTGFTNDHGTRYMVDRENGGWMWMQDVPLHLENRC